MTSVGMCESNQCVVTAIIASVMGSNTMHINSSLYSKLSE